MAECSVLCVLWSAWSVSACSGAADCLHRVAMSAYHPVCILHGDKWRWPCWWLCAWVWAGFARPHLHCASVMTKSVFHCCCFWSKPTEYFSTASDSLSQSFVLLSLHRLLLVFGRRRSWDFIGRVTSRVKHRFLLERLFNGFFILYKKRHTPPHQPHTSQLLQKRNTYYPEEMRFKSTSKHIQSPGNAGFFAATCLSLSSTKLTTSAEQSQHLCVVTQNGLASKIPVKYVQGFCLWKQPYCTSQVLYLFMSHLFMYPTGIF